MTNNRVRNDLAKGYEIRRGYEMIGYEMTKVRFDLIPSKL